MPGAVQLASPLTSVTALHPGSTTAPLPVLTLNDTVPDWPLPVTDAINVTGAPYPAILVFEDSVIAEVTGVPFAAADDGPVPAAFLALTEHA